MRDQLTEICRKATEIARSVHLLSTVSWPAHLEQKFVDGYERGSKPKLDFDYPNKSYREQKVAMSKLKDQLSEELPTHIFTRKTIDSYLLTFDLLESVQSKSFTDTSIKVYGQPKNLLFDCDFSHLEAAKTILDINKGFEHPYLEEPDNCYLAESLKKHLYDESTERLGSDCPQFVITDQIVAKATAGKNFIKLRSGTCYNEYDFDQLFYHEVMTHALTSINGSYQTNLPLLGLSAPRTTKTQEGLATFAEIITGAMNLSRLKRLALRVLAIDHALNGADLYELVEFFVSNGQSVKESYLSASRIFRGGSYKGGIVFTKDGVYLEGLIRVYSFFRWALKTSNLDLLQLLFTGKLDIDDTFLLRDELKSGYIEQPKYLPKWYEQTNLLAGKLTFSMVLNSIKLGDVDQFYSSKLRS